MTGELNEQLRVRQVNAAWNMYLVQTRGLQGFRYEEIEPWAWTKLRTELRRAGGAAGTVLPNGETA